MHRETVYTLSVDRPRDLTKQEALDMDKAQPWRRRISSGALDELTALKTILLWADSIMAGEHTQKLMRDMGVYQRTRAGFGMLKSGVEDMLGKISAVQLRTLDANWQVTNVTLSATRAAPGFVNVDVQAIETLINQALVACREGFCMADGRKSLSCPVRQAFDNCVNAGRALEKSNPASGFDQCPYSLNRAESRAID